MKHFFSSSIVCSALLLGASQSQAQDSEGEDFTPMVLVGAISASVMLVDVEFANLPSGKVLRAGPDGVEVLDPADVPETSPSVPRITVGAVDTLPAAQKQALARRLERVLDQIMIAYDDGVVSADDVIEIVKFLLAVDLPFDERFRGQLVRRFGPLVDTIEPDDGETQVVDPILLEPDEEPQVTDPIDLTPYFAP
ncbi:MAG: hypothetical protein AAGJ81_07260 [Verrucomicrobiota bacterium]